MAEDQPSQAGSDGQGDGEQPIFANAYSVVEIVIHWTLNPDFQGNVIISRSTDSVNFGPIARVGSQFRTFTDSSVEPGEHYSYRLNVEGNDDEQFECESIKYNMFVGPPTGLTVTSQGGGNMGLTWVAAPGTPPFKYDIYRSIYPNTPIAKYPGVIGTTFTDHGLSVGTNYCYQVLEYANGVKGSLCGAVCATA